MEISVERLEAEIKRCSDGILTKEYRAMLDALDVFPLTQELVDYLCSKIVSKKHFWEIRFDHLRPLLLNPSAMNFDMKAFYEERFKRSRRLCMRMYFLRGYTMYAKQAEVAVLSNKFEAAMKKGHDYIDYMDIMSENGLLYLVRTYGYGCFHEAWQTAQTEYAKISPYLRGYITTDERLRNVQLLSTEEVMRRQSLFLKELQAPKYD